jgi:hypothetical protein
VLIGRISAFFANFCSAAASSDHPGADIFQIGSPEHGNHLRDTAVRAFNRNK